MEVINSHAARLLQYALLEAEQNMNTLMDTAGDNEEELAYLAQVVYDYRWALELIRLDAD